MTTLEAYRKLEHALAWIRFEYDRTDFGSAVAHMAAMQARADAITILFNAMGRLKQ